MTSTSQNVFHDVINGRYSVRISKIVLYAAIAYNDACIHDDFILSSYAALSSSVCPAMQRPIVLTVII